MSLFALRNVGGCFQKQTVLPTARHRRGITSKEAVLPVRNDAEMRPIHSLHAFGVIEREKIWFCFAAGHKTNYYCLLNRLSTNVNNCAWKQLNDSV